MRLFFFSSTFFFASVKREQPRFLRQRRASFDLLAPFPVARLTARQATPTRSYPSARTGSGVRLRAPRFRKRKSSSVAASSSSLVSPRKRKEDSSSLFLSVNDGKEHSPFSSPPAKKTYNVVARPPRGPRRPAGRPARHDAPGLVAHLCRGAAVNLIFFFFLRPLAWRALLLVSFLSLALSSSRAFCLCCCISSKKQRQTVRRDSSCREHQKGERERETGREKERERDRKGKRHRKLDVARRPPAATQLVKKKKGKKKPARTCSSSPDFASRTFFPSSQSVSSSRPATARPFTLRAAR